MREIRTESIIEPVAAAIVDANLYLPRDVKDALARARETETGSSGRTIMDQLLENADTAANTGLPLCQDTGLAVFFVYIGKECCLRGDLTEALNEAVRRGYSRGRLRNSVCHPLTRENTGDNTPAVIHTELVPGMDFRIRFMAKGGGSENMSRATMLTPSGGWEGIKDFVLSRVAEAGPNPCPPTIVGLGIGGSFDRAPILAKEALFRPLGEVHPDPELAGMEEELLTAVNRLGIGPMGLGGEVTSLGVKINMAPCHIASLPLAVNIQCHSARRAEVSL
ncbi:MAG: fumarate hydratase [Desulfonatronovibrionaceae bacterium]